MFAVIQTGGKQYRVTADDVIRVEKLPGEAGDRIEIAEVLMLETDAGTEIGAPRVEGARVTATIIEQARAPKILVFKKQRRKNHRRTRGHRQALTVLRIGEILPAGAKPKAAAKKADPEKTETKKAETKKAEAKKPAPAAKTEKAAPKKETKTAPAKTAEAKKETKKAAAKASPEAKKSAKTSPAKKAAPKAKAKASAGEKAEAKKTEAKKAAAKKTGGKDAKES